MTQYDVIIIGGGPSGMMAAGTIVKKHPNAQVLLIEKNKKLGEKLSITGGGRCNITHAIFDEKLFLKKYGEAEKYLYSAFSQFSVQDTFNFFQEKNLPLVIEAYNRVFPQSQKATDVTEVMKKYCLHPNITIKTDETISKIHTENKNSIIEIKNIETKKGERYSASSYIFATGGLSHPETGSTGDGFTWLENLGHQVKKPSPTLVPWKVSDIWIHDNSGTSIEDVKITIYMDTQKYFSCIGKILLTQTGLSGPLILNKSNLLKDALDHSIVTGFIDIYPQKNHKELDEHILSIFEKNKNKKLKNVISEITKIPHSEFLIKKYFSSYDMDIQINLVSKEFRKSLIQLLKNIPLTISGLEGYEKSIITDGGVSLDEIDTRTMNSRRVTNLYITGDLLDIRRPSGGFSLQLCWTTGFVAGIHCLKNFTGK